MNQLKLFGFKKRQSSPGGIWQLSAIAFPIMASQVCEVVMTFTDRIFLSHINPGLMAALMRGQLSVLMFTIFFFGLTGYTTALVGQYFGAKNFKNCLISAHQSLLVSAVCFPILLACIPLGHFIFDLLGSQNIDLKDSRSYFNILMAGAAFSIFRNSLNSFFAGIGKTGIIMFSSAATLLLNVLFNYILIFGHFGFPAMGITGAAMGTVLASCCGMLIMMTGYVKFNWSSLSQDLPGYLKIDIKILKKLIFYGSPAGFEMLMSIIAFNFIVFSFHSYGPEIAASTTIAYNWDLLAYIPLLGINIAITSLVGRYVGAKDFKTAKAVMGSGIRMVLIFSVFIFSVFMLFTDQLVGIFLHSPIPMKNIAPLAGFMLKMVAVYIAANGFILVLSGVLRGAGDSHATMLITIIFNWLLALEVMVLINGFKCTPGFSWSVYVCSLPLLSGLLYLRYKSNKWQRINLLDNKQEEE